MSAAGPGRRVLLVDDNAPFRSAARRVLVDAGFDVVAAAADAAGALRLAGRLHPDVVLVDVELPDRDGFQLAGQLLRLPRPPVVVLISGRPRADYGRLVERSGARGFIDKADLSGPRLYAELA